MNCPDWSGLAEERERSLTARSSLGGAASEESAAERAWRDAQEHRAGCSACQRDALAVDPLLLFQNLPRPVVSAQDVLEMQQRVAGARRMLPRDRDQAGRLPGGQYVRRGVAAALLVLALGAAVSLRGPLVETLSRTNGSVVSAEVSLDNDLLLTAREQAIREQAVREEAAQKLDRLPLVMGDDEIDLQVAGVTFDYLNMSFGH